MNADKRRWFFAICALILSISIDFIPRLQAEEPDLYSNACKSFVEILIENHLDGSGWIASADGIVVTPAHVVGSPGKRIEINSESLGRLEAKVIAVDLGNDTALLKLPTRDTAYPALAFAEKVPVA